MANCCPELLPDESNAPLSFIVSELLELGEVRGYKDGLTV